MDLTEFRNADIPKLSLEHLLAFLADVEALVTQYQRHKLTPPAWFQERHTALLDALPRRMEEELVTAETAMRQLEEQAEAHEATVTRVEELRAALEEVRHGRTS